MFADQKAVICIVIGFSLLAINCTAGGMQKESHFVFLLTKILRLDAIARHGSRELATF